MSAAPPETYIIKDHAHFEMKRRGITEDQIRQIFMSPQQTQEVRTGRWVYQSRIKAGEQEYLIRVFVDVDREPAEVVTVYRTSKVEKYWGATP